MEVEGARLFFLALRWKLMPQMKQGSLPVLLGGSRG